MVKKKKNRYAWAILALVVASGAGFYIWKKPEPVALTTTTEVSATKGDLIIGFESDGKASLPFDNLDFEVSGKLATLNVAVGDTVKIGQIVATIDPKDFKRSYDAAKLAYEKANLNYKAKVESQKLALVTESEKVISLKRDWDRLLKDYQDMLIISETYAATEIEAKKRLLENAQQAYMLANEQHLINKNSTYSVAIEKVNVESAKLQMDIAKENVDKTILKASRDGIILKISSTIGNTVGPNNSDDTLAANSSHFIVYSDSKNYEVTTSVSEQDLPMVTLGQLVRVTFDAIKNTVYEGKVTQIDELPTTDSSGIVTYGVTAELNSGFDQISIGMTATTQLIQKYEADVIIIPNRAVTMEKGIQYVQVKNASGVIEKRKIKAGLTDGRNVAVSSGLEEGETVVITKASTQKAE
jgi:multidrug efflux pump subunit AcrA (membrane-fusion protein)